MERIAERPIPLQLGIDEAHLTAVAVRRLAREITGDGHADSILVAVCERIADTLERQIGAGMKAINLTKAEVEVVVTEVQRFADALGEPDD